MKKQILAVGAHPDDIEIGCGGTLSLLRERGHELTFLVATFGEEGDQRQMKAKAAELRQSEAERAAKLLGARVLFLGEPDGLTSFSKETKLRLISLLRDLRPDIVFTHAKSDPFPDHQVVHELTMNAIAGAAGPWYPDAPQEPHKVSEVYGYEVWNPIPHPQLLINIGSALERKIAGLREHQSQIGKINYVGAVLGLAAYRGVTTMAGEYAEAFEIYKGRLL